MLKHFCPHMAAWHSNNNPMRLLHHLAGNNPTNQPGKPSTQVQVQDCSRLELKQSQPCQVQTWTPDVTNPKAKQHIQSNLETPQILYRNQRETPTKDRWPIMFVCGEGFWLQCATKSGENRSQWGLWKCSMWAAFSGCICHFLLSQKKIMTNLESQFY